MVAQQLCLRALQILLSCLVLASFTPAHAAGPLTPGAKSPTFDFTDILGVESSSKAYKDHIHIISFASKDTSEALMDWMSSASKKASQKYPAMPLAYFSFADLTEVPGFLRPIAKPILEDMISKDIEPLMEKFKSTPDTAGGSPPTTPEFHLIADWDGSFLASFGVEEIDGYYLWVVHQGRVLGSFSHKSEQQDEAYLAVFDAIAKAKVEATSKKEVVAPTDTTDS